MMKAQSSLPHKHVGGCHCGNIRIVIDLPNAPAETEVRTCAPGTCSFCAATGWRAIADPAGSLKVWAQDWSDVSRYRFGTGTAEFLACKRCSVYVAAICETESGLRAVANLNSLKDQGLFTAPPSVKNLEAEDARARVQRRGSTWMPAVVHR